MADHAQLLDQLAADEVERLAAVRRYEVERLAAVRRYDVLDTPRDGAFDRVCVLLTRFFRVPVASVTIVDEDRIWFKACEGLDVMEIPREPGLCASAIGLDGPYVVTDGRSDPRTALNSLVHGDPGVGFYAAAPITTADGYRLGTVNVIGTEPREVTDEELQTLEQFAAIVMDELGLRLAAIGEVKREHERRNELFRQAFQKTPSGMAMLELDGRFAWVNAALCRITGYTAHELEATSSRAISDPDDADADERHVRRVLNGEAEGYHAEKRFIHADGRSVWVALQATLLRDSDGAPLNFLVQIQDVTSQRHDEQRLLHIADHDPLTGLMNRRSFRRELEAHGARIRRYGPEGAVILVDLDHFKLVNDTLGHAEGDGVLAAAANALRSRLRDSDVLARVGGDEFVIILPKADARAGSLVAAQLLEALRNVTIEVDGRVRVLTASVGIALFEREGELTGADVLANADLAMYEAKNAGGNRAQPHAAGVDEPSRASGRAMWGERIERALEQDGFTLLAQPIVDFGAGAAHQYELLLRMRDEHGGLVSPGVFLDTAERIGMVQQIDCWVAGQAIDLLAERRADGGELTLQVNLSPLSIGDPELLEIVNRELHRTQVPPENLIFELTATAIVTDMARASQFARDVSQLGCRFALDDFGAGYSSFSGLKQLPFDFIKIDGELVQGCRSNETDQVLIKAIVDIAAGIGKQTIAEYVEDEETVHLLTDLGVDYGQGFHLGMPAPLG